MHVRKAEPQDARDLFDWRNDLETRKASGVLEELDWEKHVEWFSRSLSNPARQIYIAEDMAFRPFKLGMTRFDFDGVYAAEVSINLNPEARGAGLSFEILCSSIEAYKASRDDVNDLFARIREENHRSEKLFAKAGFVHIGREQEFMLLGRALQTTEAP